MASKYFVGGLYIETPQSCNGIIIALTTFNVLKYLGANIVSTCSLLRPWTGRTETKFSKVRIQCSQSVLLSGARARIRVQPPRPQECVQPPRPQHRSVSSVRLFRTSNLIEPHQTLAMLLYSSLKRFGRVIQCLLLNPVFCFDECPYLSYISTEWQWQWVSERGGYEDERGNGSSILSVLHAYKDGFHGDDAYAPAPYPPYVEARGLASATPPPPYDTCYHLLELYCHREHSVELIVQPATSTSHQLDYRIRWGGKKGGGGGGAKPYASVHSSSELFFQGGKILSKPPSLNEALLHWWLLFLYSCLPSP